MRGIGRLTRAACWLRHWIIPGLPVLLYHRVAELASDPQLLCVTPKHFAEQLEVVCRHARPVSLGELVRGLLDGVIPRKSFAVTFDDGYADNLHNAHPVLQHYGVPATVFIASGSVGSDREFWWDELDRLVLQSERLPEAIEFDTGEGAVATWQLGEAAEQDGTTRARWRGWHVLIGSDPSPRHSLYRFLCTMFARLPEARREAVLAQLRRQACCGPRGRPTHRALMREEVSQLSECGLFEIGGHTVTHTSLASLARGVQEAEIRASRAALEEMTGRAVTSFSYPFGDRSSYTAETVDLVRSAGLRCACANFTDGVRRNSDPYQLPRILVRDWDGDEFARRLSGWLRG